MDIVDILCKNLYTSFDKMIHNDNASQMITMGKYGKQTKHRYRNKLKHLIYVSYIYLSSQTKNIALNDKFVLQLFLKKLKVYNVTLFATCECIYTRKCDTYDHDCPVGSYTYNKDSCCFNLRCLCHQSS